jgi:hypothetical protein
MLDDERIPDAGWAPAVPGRPWSPAPAPAQAMAATPVPVAWLGRTSTEDAQDPTLSLPRQLSNARAALPPDWVIVAHFYDVESGRKDPGTRGHSQAHAQFGIPIPRDGGIADLLAESVRPDRRFAAVICESIERVARRTYFGTKIEYELEQAGVALLAADEPIVTGRRAKRATPTLTRRVKQAISEWYVLQMLELSWDGFRIHTEQGWNTGKPPYGYAAEKLPHPVPARRAEGRTKHRLVPDPSTAPTVTRMFHLRAFERLTYDGIADRLNLDLIAHPPPEPILGGTACGRWTGSAVRGILQNPKYTGYQVWNRRASKKGGLCNDPAEWVWSPRPTHEPLVTREVFDAAAAVSGHRRGSRPGAGANRHPATKRSYVLRSFVRCALCGRRMSGKTRNGVPYYACEVDRWQRTKAEFASHPKSLSVGEKTVLAEVSRFFAGHVFGPDRHAHLAATLAASSAAQDGQKSTAHERAQLEKDLAALERRQGRLIQTLAEGTGDHEDGTPHFGPDEERAFRDGIRTQHAALVREHRTLSERLAKLTATPAAPTGGDPALLDALPVLPVDLARVPEELQRRLYDAFQLQITYHRPQRELTLRVTIAADAVNTLVSLSDEMNPHGRMNTAGHSANVAQPTKTTTSLPMFCAPLTGRTPTAARNSASNPPPTRTRPRTARGSPWPRGRPQTHRD